VVADAAVAALSVGATTGEAGASAYPLFSCSSSSSSASSSICFLYSSSSFSPSSSSSSSTLITKTIQHVQQKVLTLS